MLYAWNVTSPPRWGEELGTREGAGVDSDPARAGEAMAACLLRSPEGSIGQMTIVHTHALEEGPEGLRPWLFARVGQSGAVEFMNAV